MYINSSQLKQYRLFVKLYSDVLAEEEAVVAGFFYSMSSDDELFGLAADRDMADRHHCRIAETIN